jgi:hypothetical protein
MDRTAGPIHCPPALAPPPARSMPTPSFCRLRAVLCAVVLGAAPLVAQQPVPTDTAQLRRDSVDRVDSVFMERVERASASPKVYHAEPLFIDLLRDLGARKGEAEWNVGFGMTDRLAYDEYKVFVEYEWAPIDRLGLEIELPASIHTALDRNAAVPRDRLESLKLGAQWTAVVDTARHLSVAVAYLHEVLLPASLRDVGRAPVAGHLFNPFAVIARRWGTNWHTLLYAGPRLVRERGGRWQPGQVQANWNLHYMLPGTRNFVGVEFNQVSTRRTSDVVIRPQMRLALNDHLLVGIAAGVPVNRQRERLGLFLRLIYEPRTGNRSSGHG